MPSDDVVTFADVSFGNLTEEDARFVQANTPDDARTHVRRSFHRDFYIVLVEDLSIPGARDLFTALAQHRATASLDFPDVPDWRDIRTGTERAWREFADAHGIDYPHDSTRQRIAIGVRNWLEQNR